MDFEEFRKRYCGELDEAQLSAVISEGGILLLAVPGSGKTTVLVDRIGYMVFCKGIPARNILAVTYTRAAATGMKERYIENFGIESGEKVSFRTINSLCAAVTEQYFRHEGKVHPRIPDDETTVNTILSGLYRQFNGCYPARDELSELKMRISFVKNMMLTEKEIPSYGKSGTHFPEIYAGYRKAMSAQGLMDLDDQMVFARRIFMDRPDILDGFRKRFCYLLVDEAQDTSRIQHEIISLLAGDGRTLFMVGDEDQSIYGFRAAYPQALTDFRKRYPGSRILFLENNYRSAENIAEAAERFVSRSLFRTNKKMRAVRKEPGSVTELWFDNGCELRGYLSERASTLSAPAAVLYRENVSAVPLIDHFERTGTKYTLLSDDITFFGGRFLRDIRDIVSFSLDQRDTALFMRISGILKLPLSAENVRKACAVCRKEKTDILTAALSLPRLTKAQKKEILSFFDRLGKMNRLRADKAVRYICEELGYKGSRHGSERKRNDIAALCAVGEHEKDIKHLLERIDLLGSIIAEKKSSPERGLILSTVHSSKGLEYSDVYIVDSCDGIFPPMIPDMSYADEEQLKKYEEERRLFYVAVTRAKNRVVLLREKDSSSLFCDELLGKA